MIHQRSRYGGGEGGRSLPSELLIVGGQGLAVLSVGLQLLPQIFVLLHQLLYLGSRIDCSRLLTVTHRLLAGLDSVWRRLGIVLRGLQLLCNNSHITVTCHCYTSIEDTGHDKRKMFQSLTEMMGELGVVCPCFLQFLFQNEDVSLTRVQIILKL